jgi:hypothetical protein
LNVANSQLSFTNWLGILFINVFGTWTGNFSVETSDENNTPPPTPPSTSNSPSGSQSQTQASRQIVNVTTSSGSRDDVILANSEQSSDLQLLGAQNNIQPSGGAGSNQPQQENNNWLKLTGILGTISALLAALLLLLRRTLASQANQSDLLVDI